MFSPEKIVYSFINNHKKEPQVNLTWEKLFKELFCTLYFQNHLQKHQYRPAQVILCLGRGTNLEVLNLVNLITQKYPFFKLRQSEPSSINVDLEKDYLLNSTLVSSKILASDTCLLIGVNPRYEGSKLNLELRSRYFKGNFNVIQVGSLSNLTYSSTNLSNNTKVLKSLVEGNNLFCQELVNSANPILISNEEIFKRKDSLGLTNMIRSLTQHVNLFAQYGNKSRLNILSSTSNSVGFANFNHIKPIENKDFSHSTGIYFVNSSLSTSNIKKLLSLKLLNFFQSDIYTSKTLITQNSKLNVKLATQLKKSFNLNNHLHLPNTTLYETSGTYMNTRGDVNKVVKVITPLGQSKSDWQILRKMLSYSRKALFITNFFRNDKIDFNSSTIRHFKIFVGFQHYSVHTLNNLAFQLLEKITECDVNVKVFKPRKNKLLNSQLRYWLNDFYIDGKDLDSKYSSTMIQCSKLSRLNSTNFKF